MDSNQPRMITLTDTDRMTEELVATASAELDAEPFSITDNKEAAVYEYTVEGRAAAGLLYQETGTRVTLLATSVFPEFRGHGIAGKLLGGVLDMLRSQGRTVTLTCPFATAFVKTHPEYADIVDPAFPGNASSRQHGRRH